MCEIAILDPRRYSVTKMAEASMLLYESMGTSLGLVFIRENGDGTKFQYDIHKSLEPERSEVESFIREHESGSVRFIIHGRLATHGANTVENCHPLEINCEECDVDYALHNGVLYNHRRLKNEHESVAHNYSTPVDSEAIAHEYGEVPLEFASDEEHEKRNRIPEQPAFILMNEDGAYINASRYHLSERGEMAHNYRSFAPDRSVNDYQEVILTPTNAE